MSSYNYDDELGLTDVGEIQAGEMYEVDSFLVAHDERGTFYWIEGQGCSCWEGYGIHAREDFNGSGNAQAAHDALNNWAGIASEDVYARANKVAGEVAELHQQIASTR